MNDSDWDGYRILLGVVERGSLSRAARELGISQPTASRRIADLERALGVRLLLRRSRGVVPTPAGARVVAEAQRMASCVRAAARVVDAGAPTPSRRVVISATEGLGTLWLPARVAELTRTTGRRIDLEIDNAPSDLSTRQADIAIRLFRPAQPDLVARNSGKLGFGLFAAPAYLRARGTPHRLADLARHDHIGFRTRTGSTPSYLRWLETHVPPERFVTSASSLLAMYELARAGHGIVAGTVALLAGDRTLARILPRATPPAMDIWLAVHADVRRDPDVLAVLDALATALAADARALAGKLD